MSRRDFPSGGPLYILNARGEYAGVALYGEDEDERGWAGQTDGRRVRFSVCTENGPQTILNLCCPERLQTNGRPANPEYPVLRFIRRESKYENAPSVGSCGGLCNGLGLDGRDCLCAKAFHH